MTPTTVQSLLESGQPKRAVEAAKELVRRSPGPDAEALLAEAFVARILSFDSQMAVEAESLYAVARERCPLARGVLESARPRIAVRFGRFDEALRPLGQDPTPGPVRERIEDALRRELVDVRGLANCDALPESHPLREAAREIAEAFEAVTSGPVADERLAMHSVSRRSPLAAWKPLVRAIACFHRRDDVACAAQLASVDAGSSPVRLVPLITRMMAGQSGGARDVLADRILATGKPAALVSSLAELETVFGQGKRKIILEAIRKAVRVCRQARPDLVMPLFRLASARAVLAGIPPGNVREVSSPVPSQDAELHRLLANARERRGEKPEASIEWGHFLVDAVREGTFDDHSPEAAVVIEHMLDLVDRIPEEELADDYHDAFARTKDTAERLPSRFAVAPMRLYEMLVKASPRPSHFERWLDWANRYAPGRREQIAMSWSEALPEDARPLLLQVEILEKRGAHHKALKVLARAERTERLDPEVARARFRLTCAIAMRHLAAGQSKPLAKDIADLAALPESRTGHRPAFVVALQLVAQARKNGLGYEELLAEIERWVKEGPFEPRAGAEDLPTVVSVLGGAREAFFLVTALTTPHRAGLLPPGTPAEILGALATTSRLCDDLRIEMMIDPRRQDVLLEGLGEPSELDDGALVSLAGVARRSGLERFLLALSAAGLRRTTNRSRYLSMRAQSLSLAPVRQWECFAAAREMARKERDTALLAELAAAMDEARVSQVAEVSPEQVDRIVAREMGSSEYPPREIRDDRVVECLCPSCRAARERAKGSEEQSGGEDEFVSPFGPDDEDDEFYDPDDEGPYDPDDEDDAEGAVDLPWEVAKLLSPELLDVFAEVVAKYGEMDPAEVMRRDPSLGKRMEQALKRTPIGRGLPSGGGRRKPRKKRKRRSR